MKSPKPQIVPITSGKVAIRDGVFRARSVAVGNISPASFAEFKLSDIICVDIYDRSNGYKWITYAHIIIFSSYFIVYNVIGTVYPKITFGEFMFGMVAIYFLSIFLALFCTRYWYVLAIRTEVKLFELTSVDEVFLKRVKFLIEQELLLQRTEAVVRHGAAGYEIDVAASRIDAQPAG